MRDKASSEVYAELCKAVHSVLKPLKLKQKDLAEGIGVSTSLISKALRAGSERQPMSQDNECKMLSLVRGHVAAIDRIKKGRSAPVVEGDGDAASLRAKALTEKASKAARDLTIADVSRIQKQLADIEAKLNGSTSGKRSSGGRIVQPRGPLPVMADNYQPRAMDAQVEKILHQRTAPANLVIAPINGGTSSFLCRVHELASRDLGAWVKLVDLESMFDSAETPSQVDIFRRIFAKIGVPADKLTGDGHDMKEAFGRWAEGAWGDRTAATLIFDGVDQIVKTAGSTPDKMALFNWIAGLRHEIACGTAPYDKLTLFVAFIGATWSAAHASPLATQSHEIAVSKFTQDEIVELFEKLEISASAYDVANIFELFHGHPYLTHLLGWDLREGATFEQARQRAVAAEGGYGAHWEEMRGAIEFLVGRSGHSTMDVLATIGKKAGAWAQVDVPDVEIDKIWLNYRRDLRVFGLWSGTFEQPKVCAFYLDMVQRDRRTLTSETHNA